MKTSVENINRSIDDHTNEEHMNFNLDLVLKEKNEKMTLAEFCAYMKSIGNSED